MRSPESFDAFYAETRVRLLHEAYALTGDLHSSRVAVRDAFTVAWQHWGKVSRLDDREGFVRPLAHRSAHRRHAARPWHRDKDIDDDALATLEALSKLSPSERKTLVLTMLAPMSLAEIAREVGLTQSHAERALQSATAAFAMARDVPSTEVRSLLESLLGPIADTRWPRSTIVRRAGTARHRTHTLLGSAGVVAALVVSGIVVKSGGVEPSTLDHESAMPSATSRVSVAAEEGLLQADSLLLPHQVKRFGPELKWREGETSDNLAGDGRAMPCQKTRFADRDGSSALMRSFTGTAKAAKSGPPRKATGGTKTGAKTGAKTGTKTEAKSTPPGATAVEYVEMSADPKAARAAFDAARGWYAGCTDARTQLLSTDAVARVGDEAAVLTLRTWSKTPDRISVGLARTGRLTVITLVRSAGRTASSRQTATGLAAAVNAACGKTGAGTCAGPPKVRSSAPIAVGKPPGLLNTVDLPPVAGAIGPWIGTDPVRARTNFASPSCDNTQFSGPGLSHDLTRTFVFPASKKNSFGVTQTVATMSPTKAVDFVNGVRGRIRGCAGAHLGTSVETLLNRPGKHSELTVWDLRIEISDNKTIPFWMAIMRDGNAVSQVGFTPADGMSMTRDDFTAIVERALERLSDLPGA